MENDFSALEAMEYSGRSFIAFRTMHDDFGFSYQLTGRSPPSQTRKFVLDEKFCVIRTELITDPKVLKKMFNVTDEQMPGLLKKIEGGNRALTIYPAMRCIIEEGKKRLIVSNGAQTKSIYNAIMNSRARASPGDILARAFSESFFEYDEVNQADIDLTSFEPDHPIFTPRINGCMDAQRFAYRVIRKNPMSREVESIYNEYPLEPGKGILIATYKGGNEKPFPLSFESPLEINVGDLSARGICRRVYDIITRPNPNDSNKVYGVSVATMTMRGGEDGLFEVGYNRINFADEVMRV